MKKLLVLALSALFVLGLTASAFAVHSEIPAETQAVVAKGTTQITLGGSMRIRGEMRTNIADRNSDLDDSNAWYDQRARLSIGAKVADNLEGLIHLQSGTAGAVDTWTWGAFNAHPQTVAILESWLQYKAPSFGVKAGHMPLSLGNKLFFDHTRFGDDALVFFMDPSKEIHVGVLTIKAVEGNAAVNADVDGYGGLVTYKGAAFNAGADVVYVQDHGSFLSPGKNANLMNIGLRGNAKLGPASVKANVEIQSGSIEKGASATQDMDLSANAIMVGADMMVGPAKVGVEVGMGSGNEVPTTGVDTTNEKYNTLLSGGIPYYSFVYDTRLAGPCGATAQGICGTTYVKVSGDTKMGDIGINAAIIYLKASEEAIRPNLGAVGSNTKSDDLGIEVDATVTYQVAKNLKYWVEGGYFMAGEWYSNRIAGATTDPDAAFALRHGIELTF